MRISLYLDEDSRSNSLVHALRSRGVDVTTAREAQMLGFADLEQLVWATSQRRVLYSFNIRDFFRLRGDFLGQGKSHAGSSSPNNSGIQLVNRCVDCSS